jgi:hypothetical protein
MKLALTVILLFSHMIAATQVIKMGNGFSHSYVKDKIGNILCSHNGYSMDLGIDYLEYKDFYLSTTVGYTPIGIYGYTHNGYGSIHSYTKYINANVHLTTTLNCKTPFFYKSFIFAGIGPRMDYTVNQRKISQEEGLIYDGNTKWLFQVKGELGLFYDINKYRISISYSYSRNFSHMPSVKIHSCLLSIGYIL